MNNGNGQVPIEKLVNVLDDYFTLCSQFSGKLRPYIWVEMGVKLNCKNCVLHFKSSLILTGSWLDGWRLKKI